MKKHLLLLLALVPVVLASCVRTEDIELLKHPIHVQGEVDPYLGVPIAYGELDMNDILAMLSQQYTGLVDPTANTITIYFESELQDTIWANSLSSSKHSKRAPSKTIHTKSGSLISVDTTKVYSVDVTIFDDAQMQGITSADIQISHMWFKMNAVYQGFCKDTVRDVVQNYVHATIDSLVIKYTGHNYQEHVFNGTPDINIIIDSILKRQTIEFDSVDLAPIINSMPRRITASFRFRFNIDDSWIINNVTNPSFADMMDSIKMTYLAYDADLALTFPFDIHIGMLPYSFDVDLGEGLSTINIDSILSSLGDNVNAELKDSYLNLAFDNGIPFNFIMGASLLDSMGIELMQIVSDTTIKAAPTAQMANDPSTWEATGTTRTVVRAKLNSDKLRMLKRGRKIRVTLAVSSGEHKVAVQRTNTLRLKASVQVHPSASFDIPITEDGVL